MGVFDVGPIPVDALAIMQAIADKHELVGIHAMMVRGRPTRAIADARLECWRIMRDQLGERGLPRWTLEQIGSWFGVWHSAISNALGPRVDETGE